MAEQTIESELLAGEQLLWAGQPQTGLRLDRSDAFVIPFSLMWGGFAIFWEICVLSSKAPIFADLWGIPFVLVGLYLIAGRFFFDAAQRSKTWYGVTNERVVIVSDLFGRKVVSLQYPITVPISLSQSKDGLGGIMFGTPLPHGSRLHGAGSSGVPEFRLIPEAKAVYEIVLRAQQAHTSRPRQNSPAIHNAAND